MTTILPVSMNGCGSLIKMVVDPSHDPEVINIHLAGLRNIIDLRHGYDGLPMSLTQWLVLYESLSVLKSLPDLD